MFKRSVENPNRFYITLFGKRYVFDMSYKKGKYVGWYRP